jgi:hypothetical protein
MPTDLQWFLAGIMAIYGPALLVFAWLAWFAPTMEGHP